ncbi:unnamed protein product [Mytilus edulis]|uniref:Endonuclease/exonuclease/phosphatase domain-containing protein n=1 Tax=Mytilus edulis TaxID=6550 RepID=A0A8S3UFX7_MYTED|nr:unnamed protein product [Mytilus edulis]
MIALKREGHQNVRLVLDKLYVGNQLYNDHVAPNPSRSRQDAYAHGPQPGFVPSRERFPPRGPPQGHHAGPVFQSGSAGPVFQSGSAGPESKLDKHDILELPKGYLYFSKHRSKFKKKSGGIVIIHRENFEKFLNFPKTKSDYVQWLVIHSNMLMIDKNLLLGCIYIPPENTKYASNDAFNDIETEMSELIEKTNSYVSLVGDFNAKTKLLSDIVIPDSKLFEILDDIVDDDFYLMYDSNTPTHTPRWIPTKQKQFIESINNDVTMVTTIESLLDELDELGQGQHTKNTINLVVNKVGELFKNSAKKVFGSNGRKEKQIKIKSFKFGLTTSVLKQGKYSTKHVIDTVL